MSAYLRNYVESVAELPSELSRCFKLMRELDSSAHELQQQADEASRRRLAEFAAQAAGPPPPTAKRQRAAYDAAAAAVAAAGAEADAKIEADMKQVRRSRGAQVLHLADEKVNLASKIYDYVDQRIRRLDLDMAAFDEELARDRAKLGVMEELAVAPSANGGAAAGGGGRGRRGHRDGKPGRRSGALAAEAAAGPGPAPLLATEGGLVGADPCEPVYCYCRNVSHGEMVACDNPDCAIEWFHYACVGLSPDAPPPEQWFCRECAAARGLPPPALPEPVPKPAAEPEGAAGT